MEEYIQSGEKLLFWPLEFTWGVPKSQVWEMVALGRHWRFSWKQQQFLLALGLPCAGHSWLCWGSPGEPPLPP